ncbi:MAG: SDR family NAD(P)-dependent oxidoreductase [Bacteriovoracaceae bacterium]
MRKALVTGANKGIGLETVKQLRATGYMVYMAVRDLNKGKLALKSFTEKDLQNIVLLELDVSKAESVTKAFSTLQELDVLINNAGINYDSWNTVSAADLENVHETFETNFFGAWRTTQAAIPLLKKSSSARIVNVSSEAGSLQSLGANSPGYSASKAALNAFTISLAHELSQTKILVNSICPGWIATDMGGAGGGSVELGGKSIMWAVNIPDGGPSGGFFRHGKSIPW